MLFFTNSNDSAPAGMKDEKRSVSEHRRPPAAEGSWRNTNGPDLRKARIQVVCQCVAGGVE